MRRKLFHFAAAVSLLMCVGAAALWARRWASDSVTLTDEDPSFPFVRQVILNSQPSGLKFQLVWETQTTAAAADGRSPRWIVHCFSQLPEEWMWGEESRANRLGFWYSDFRRNAPNRHDRIIKVGVPHWVAVACFGALPACWSLRRYRRVDRRRRGLCERCGYDLRGTPDRCPECGVLIPAAAA
jgi:hypothetical protein